MAAWRSIGSFGCRVVLLTIGPSLSEVPPYGRTVNVGGFRKLAIREGQVGIFALGQSGFIVRFASGAVLVDGYFSAHPERLVDSPLKAAEATGLDLIAFTHEHGDHLDLDSVPALAQASPRARMVIPRPCVGMLTEIDIPDKRISGMQPGEQLTEGGVQVHAIPARHAMKGGDPYTFGDESGGGVRFLGYVFSAGGVGVYHAGDTLDYEGLDKSLRRLNVDLALLPINGRDPERESRGIAGNLDPEEAAALALRSGVDVVVPAHYDMFAANPGFPDVLVRAVRARGPGLTVVVLAAGSGFVYTKATL